MILSAKLGDEFLKKLGSKLNVFFYQNRDKGIPNLMLYVALGNAIVLIIDMILGNGLLRSILCFHKASILQGQVWRLITFVFTQSSDGFLGLIFLYFFYMLGRHVELSMGTLKFNLFYLTGILLMDGFAMIFATNYTSILYLDMGYYLHLSLILTFATTNPDSQFMILFIIPIKAWIMALIYLVLVLVSVLQLRAYFPHNLFPLAALANYFIFMGGDIVNLLPPALRAKRYRKVKANPAPKTGTIPFRPAAEKADYLHRCTVCGRTDITNPELEFRYCSRCNGYHCYCEDHISNHTHIE